MGEAKLKATLIVDVDSWPIKEVFMGKHDEQSVDLGCTMVIKEKSKEALNMDAGYRSNKEVLMEAQDGQSGGSGAMIFSAKCNMKNQSKVHVEKKGSCRNGTEWHECEGFGRVSEA